MKNIRDDINTFEGVTAFSLGSQATFFTEPSSNKYLAQCILGIIFILIWLLLYVLIYKR